MQSCIYEGRVEHRRFAPVTHRFRRKLYMMSLDLDEVPYLVRSGLISDKKYAPASFLRSDHFGDPAQPLAVAIGNLVQERTGQRPTGPIHVVTQLRTFGYYFSPINLFYCYDSSGKHVEFLVAEVTNTPWKEMHPYVLWAGNRSPQKGSLNRFEDQKTLHVSPFMEMNYDYRWRVNDPGERLIIRLENWRDGESRFDATLSLHKRPLDKPQMRSILWRYPAMPARITAGIYFEALKLWIKQCPYQPHPNDKLAKPI